METFVPHNGAHLFAEETVDEETVDEEMVDDKDGR
jgi:hypothetical protein